MTSLPKPSAVKLGLVIDLDTCVGCQACVVNCKEWNTSGYGAPLSDENPYSSNPNGAWLNRVHAYEEFYSEKVIFVCKTTFHYDFLRIYAIVKIKICILITYCSCNIIFT